ncbi:hypothetical protein HDV00_012466 [Rhizophlyctis rosea]|nr:hypothetical protein HDV00_012466 [Rhizophlyctis rosea]
MNANQTFRFIEGIVETQCFEPRLRRFDLLHKNHTAGNLLSLVAQTPTIREITFTAHKDLQHHTYACLKERLRSTDLVCTVRDCAEKKKKVEVFGEGLRFEDGPVASVVSEGL